MPRAHLLLPVMQPGKSAGLQSPPQSVKIAEQAPQVLGIYVQRELTLHVILHSLFLLLDPAKSVPLNLCKWISGVSKNELFLYFVALHEDAFSYFF